jgi:hypothetical protein
MAAVHLRATAHASTPPLTAADRKRITSDFERSAIAISTLGPHVRVLAPAQLCQQLLSIGRQLSASYGG